MSSLKTLKLTKSACSLLGDSMPLSLVEKLLPHLESLSVAISWRQDFNAGHRFLSAILATAPKLKSLSIIFDGFVGVPVEQPSLILQALRDGAAPQLEHLDCDLGKDLATGYINPDLFHVAVHTIHTLSSKGKLKSVILRAAGDYIANQLAQFLGVAVSSVDFLDRFKSVFGMPLHSVGFYPHYAYFFITLSTVCDDKRREDIFRMCYPDISSLPSQAAKEDAVRRIVNDLHLVPGSPEWPAKKLLSLSQYFRFPSDAPLWHIDPQADPYISAAVRLGNYDFMEEHCGYELIERLVLQDSRHLISLSLQYDTHTAILRDIIPRLLRKIGRPASTTLSQDQIDMICNNFWSLTIETYVEGEDKLEAIQASATALVKFFSTVPQRVQDFVRETEGLYENTDGDIAQIRETIKNVLRSVQVK
jgi:hypothetical protein